MDGCGNSPPTRPNIHHRNYLMDKMTTIEDPSTTTIIICNHNAQKILEAHKYIRIIFTIPPNTIGHNPTTE